MSKRRWLASDVGRRETSVNERKLANGDRIPRYFMVSSFSSRRIGGRCVGCTGLTNKREQTVRALRLYWMSGLDPGWNTGEKEGRTWQSGAFPCGALSFSWTAVSTAPAVCVCVCLCASGFHCDLTVFPQSSYTVRRPIATQLRCNWVTINALDDAL